MTAARRAANGTGPWHEPDLLTLDEPATERALANLSASEQKTLLIGLYCADLIDAEQVSFWFYVYGLCEA